MDVDKLEAGPELDALVAERVMGWRGAGLKAAEVGVLWCPSSRIADAWEVLSLFRGAGWDFLCEHCNPKPVLFALQRQQDGAFVEVRAETVPLAICRAALKIVAAGLR